MFLFSCLHLFNCNSCNENSCYCALKIKSSGFILPKQSKLVYFTGNDFGKFGNDHRNVVYKVMKSDKKDVSKYNPPSIMFSDMKDHAGFMQITAMWNGEKILHFHYPSNGITTKRPKYCNKSNTITNINYQFISGYPLKPVKQKSINSYINWLNNNK